MQYLRSVSRESYERLSARLNDSMVFQRNKDKMRRTDLPRKSVVLVVNLALELTYALRQNFFRLGALILTILKVVRSELRVDGHLPKSVTWLRKSLTTKRSKYMSFSMELPTDDEHNLRALGKWWWNPQQLREAFHPHSDISHTKVIDCFSYSWVETIIEKP